MTNVRWRIVWILSVAALAIAVRLAAVRLLPLDTHPESDQGLIVSLARSLADGKGFQIEQGTYWQGQPTACRNPGWPLLASVVFSYLPARWDWLASQLIGVLFDVANVLLVIVLSRRIGAGWPVSLVAGSLYAINPVLAGMAATVNVEPVGFTFLLSSLAVLIGLGQGRRPLWVAFAGGLLLGCACLVRTNWVLVAAFSGAGFLWLHRRRLVSTVGLLFVYGLATLLPLMPWLLRNANVFGRFPAFGATGGETVLGGNNDVAAEVGGKYWGYFVFPDWIPGETPLAVLAQTRTELSVDDYYRNRAWQWIRSNPRKLPGLVLGKVIRAYVPIPRTRGLPALAGSVFRWMLYVLGAYGTLALWRRGQRIGRHALMMFGAVALAQFVTVIMFCGYFRYVLASELLLSIPAGWSLVHLWRVLGNAITAAKNSRILIV